MSALLDETREADNRPAGGPPEAVQAYLRSGYSQLSHAVVDYWMPKMSGAEFKLIIFFLRATIGERSKRIYGDTTLAASLDEITRQTGLDRESTIKGIRDLEGRVIISAQRAHRQTTVYKVELLALIDPWVGKTDSATNSRVRKTDSKAILVSGKPTQICVLESGKPTPYKEINKAAAAAASRAGPLEKTEALTTEDKAEIRRIEESTKIRMDGKDALILKAGAEKANLTLAHLRWFLADEKFPSARNPRAVLLTIVREFAERAVGVRWPDSLDVQPLPRSKGLTREEILQQR